MTFFLLLCMLYEMSGGRRTGVDLSAPHVQMKYAPVMELVDMRDLRCCHLSEEFFINHVKAGVACFYRYGSSETLRLGQPLSE